MNKPNKKLGILLYNNVQPMDVIGPWEVFATWKTLLNAPIDLFLVAETDGEVHCANQINLRPHCAFNHSGQFDYLLIPGGVGRREQAYNQNLLLFIKKQAKRCEYLLAVCTGAFLLHAAGLLVNQKATTYWRAIPEFKLLNDVQLVEKRIVKSDKIWTTGGISSGIDLAFEFIKTIAGNDVAGEVQLLFEYFPSHTLYSREEMIKTLPPYHAGEQEDSRLRAKLPLYIRNYIKKGA